MDITDISRFYNNPVEDLKNRLPVHKTGKSGAQHKIDKNSKLYKASQEFEALFVKQMLDTMRKTINKTGLLDGGYAEDIFEDMLFDKYALKIAENGNLGLSDTLYRQLEAYDDHSQASAASDRGLF